MRLHLPDYFYASAYFPPLFYEGTKTVEQFACSGQFDGFAKVKLNLKNNTNVENFKTELPLRVLTRLYAPLVIVIVERSFSTYKNLLSSKRQRLTVKNVEMCVLQYNNLMQ